MSSSIRVKGGYLTKGDACEYRAGFRQRGWRPGFVHKIGRRRVLVEALSGGIVEILPGRRGKLRVPDGPRIVEIAHETAHLFAPPPAPPLTEAELLFVQALCELHSAYPHRRAHA